MTTHPRDVVAVPDQSLIFNQPALKQVAVLFNRIALPALSRLPAMPEPNINLTEHLTPLADMGILFEPEIQKSDDAGFKSQTLHDIDELYKPAGVSAEDLLGSRTDEKKASELKEKIRATNWESNSENDPFAMFRAIQRMVANMTRLTAVQLRNLHNLFTYPRGTRRCYFARRKLVLLEGEALSEISEVAFVLRTSFLSEG